VRQPLDTPATNNSASLLTCIGEHYTVVREIGRGGMATVYLCTDARDGSRVAVKVLRQEIGSQVVIERFLREISFASGLDHPRIPKVLESGVVNGLPYYGMTYVEGEMLRDRLDRERQLPVGDAISITCALIGPTTYAHERGIIHRDIKPENIILAEDGVYVLDFGIARAIVESGADRLTSTGVGVGTPAYMSPEQALGDHTLDARSDVYAIGCVLYEMIAGIPPFVGATSQAIISRRFLASAPPLREVRENVPDWLESTVAKALARAPADRFQSAAALRNALEAPPAGISTGTPRLIRRWSHRSKLIGYAFGAVLLVAVSTAFWSLRRDHVANGQRALQSWDFQKANAELSHAIQSTPTSAVAKLWIAQLKMLNGEAASVWKADITAALDKRDELSPRDRDRALALSAFAKNDFTDACRRFDDLSQAQRQVGQKDIATALSLADCERMDPLVVPSSASPSGFRFEGSYARADSIYTDLINSSSSNVDVFRQVVPRMEKVLAVGKNSLRSGSAVGPPRLAFFGVPIIDADTLGYRPYPVNASGAPWLSRDSDLTTAALLRNRVRLKGIALAWTNAAPIDPEAHETFSRILEASGELDGSLHSAVSEMGIARKLSRSMPDGNAEYLKQVELGNAEIRLYLRLGQFDRAALLSDSILGFVRPRSLSEDQQDRLADLLTNTAALRGRVFEVISLGERFASRFSYRTFDGQVRVLPEPVGRELIALYGYAAFGISDSISVALKRLDTQMTALIPPAELSATRLAILTRPLIMAAPSVGPTAVQLLNGSSEPTVRAIQSFAAHDLATTRALLDSLQKIQESVVPGEITTDVVLTQSWLLLQVGDTARATRELDNALNGLSAAVPRVMTDSNLAACLVRLMLLRGSIDKSRDDVNGARWRKAVNDLWVVPSGL
jgi:serine/threonine protein kinase